MEGIKKQAGRLPISQPPVAKSSSGLKSSEKDRTLSNHYVVGPAKSPLHHDMKAPGKMWRHNPTGYTSPSDAAKNFFQLGGFTTYLLKYNGL